MANILQLKITLQDVKPPIWRKFLVNDSWTFDRLHKIVQKVMGWSDYHLYQFEFGDTKIIPPDEGYLEENELDPKKVKISTFLTKEKQKCGYVYDFGDTWEHEIIVEKIIFDKLEGVKKYPECIGGERACPPEDCGGTGGYERILEVLKTGKDPWGENVQELKKWLGKWNPEEFDINKINKMLMRGI